MTEISTFGEAQELPLLKALLKSDEAEISILSLGCITQYWRLLSAMPEQSLVLGYENPLHYLQNTHYLGAIVGRVANRISGAAFVLDGQRFQVDAAGDEIQLHGGPEGLSTINWAMEPVGENGVELRHRSPDGHMGYPGNVDFCVKVTLAGTTLTYEMHATTDQVTPINLAQHSYYNLNGGGEIWGHKLHLASHHHTPMDGTNLPTGEIAQNEAAGLPVFEGASIAALDPKKRGLDHNFSLNAHRDERAPQAILESAQGMVMRLWTDQPFMQVYNASKLATDLPGLQGQKLEPFQGLCLEPQKMVNAPNLPGHEDVFLAVGQSYRQTLKVDIARADDAT